MSLRTVPLSASRQPPIEQLVHRVIEYERKRKAESSKPDRVIFVLGGVGMFCIIASLGFIVLYVKADPQSWHSFFWQVCAEISSLIGCVCILVASGIAASMLRGSGSGIRTALSDRFAHIAKVRLGRDKEDFEFVDELADNYEIETLEFVARRWTSRVSHWRDDYGLLIGSPSQLKILVLLGALLQFSIAPSLKPFLRQNLLPLSLFIASCVLVLSLALVDHEPVQRIEEIGQLLAQAAERKKQSLKSQQ